MAGTVRPFLWAFGVTFLQCAALYALVRRMT
jgi:hypothetical protein